MVLRLGLLCGVAAPMALAVATVARADINGFGNFSGFTLNQNDTGASPSIPTAGTIELTNGNSEARSIIANTPQSISTFTASFTFQATNISGFNGGLPGAMFLLENDPRAAAAVGNSVDNYGFPGITKSVGISFDLVANTTGFFTNGTIGNGAASVGPVNLASGDPINIQLTYSGSTLTESLLDTVTSAHFTTTDFLTPTIAATVGSGTAYVGFAAGTSSRGGAEADEFFSNLAFTPSVPEPSTMGLATFGILAGLSRRRQRKA